MTDSCVRCKSVLAGQGYWGNIILKYLDGEGFGPVYVYSRKEGISFEEYLKIHRPENVFLCTPVSTHFEYAREALFAGCNVFCEKMLTADEAKARELFLTAQNCGKVLFTDYIYLYSPSIRKMKELAAGIGPLRRIKGDISQYGKFYPDVDVTGNIGVHLISAAGFITDFAGAEDINIDELSFYEGLAAESSITFRTGDIQADLYASLLSDSRVRKISLIGERGELHFDMTGDPTLSCIMYDGGAGESYTFDEGNDLVYSLEAFAASAADPSGQEYMINRKCCIYVENLINNAGSV